MVNVGSCALASVERGAIGIAQVGTHIVGGAEIPVDGAKVVVDNDRATGPLGFLVLEGVEVESHDLAAVVEVNFQGLGHLVEPPLVLVFHFHGHAVGSLAPHTQLVELEAVGDDRRYLELRQVVAALGARGVGKDVVALHAVGTLGLHVDDLAHLLATAVGVVVGRGAVGQEGLDHRVVGHHVACVVGEAIDSVVAHTHILGVLAGGKGHGLDVRLHTLARSHRRHDIAAVGHALSMAVLVAVASGVVAEDVGVVDHVEAQAHRVGVLLGYHHALVVGAVDVGIDCGLVVAVEQGGVGLVDGHIHDVAVDFGLVVAVLILHCHCRGELHLIVILGRMLVGRNVGAELIDHLKVVELDFAVVVESEGARLVALGHTLVLVVQGVVAP